MSSCRITIVDYGMGNLRSVQKAFEALGFSTRVSGDFHDVQTADRLVLPGDGAFGDCMENLRTGGLVHPIREHIDAGRPLLGICLGLQVLFEGSEEFGRHQGLGVLPGRVVRFQTGMREGDEELKVPHMGWNQLSIRHPGRLLDGVEQGASAYFVHSYFVVPATPEIMASETTHGVEFCSSIARDNLFATQFHPEKSQRVGLRILENFARA